MLVADYYPKTRLRPATTVIYRLVEGRRVDFITFNVTNKAEGRTVARSYGAKPWNF